jgi:hypothetical protein
MIFRVALSTRKSANMLTDHHWRGWDGVNITTAERELIERMRRFVKAELKRADLTYEELAARLGDMGHDETKISVANKVNRGTFPATFFVAVMRAIGRQTVNLEEV